MDIIGKYFLNSRSQLEYKLNQMVKENGLGSNSKEEEKIKEIRQEIWELNQTKVTVENMFELLENIKCI